MLSALIYSRLSYPAVPLAGQLVHQRSVHSGPLVMFKSRVTTCIDYIFTHLFRLGRRHVIADFSPLSWHKASVVTGSMLFYNYFSPIVFSMSFLMSLNSQKILRDTTRIAIRSPIITNKLNEIIISIFLL